MVKTGDMDRLREEYAERKRHLAYRKLYSSFNPAQLFMLQQRQRDTLALLRRLSIHQLQDLDILELGCGSGGVLIEYLACAASPERLHGCDLLPDRVREAHERLPHLPLACADGQNLPYPAGSFDLAMQYTAFSSVLNEQVKANLAREMMRVLKPGGRILWYDFWLNPTNPQTRGIRPAEIRRLFPDCWFIFRKITLAPPIARRVIPVSWGLAYFLESLRVFNSHYLAVIQPMGQAG